VRRPGYEAI